MTNSDIFFRRWRYYSRASVGRDEGIEGCVRIPNLRESFYFNLRTLCKGTGFPGCSDLEDHVYLDESIHVREFCEIQYSFDLEGQEKIVQMKEENYFEYGKFSIKNLSLRENDLVIFKRFCNEDLARFLLENKILA